MRPQILNPLFASVSSLEGIGDKSSGRIDQLLAKSNSHIANVADLLFHFPVSVVDRQNTPAIKFADIGQIVTLEVKIGSYREPPPHSNAPFRVVASDDTGEITLVFFRNRQWPKKMLPIGEIRFVSGKVELFNGAPQMVHPDFILTADEFLKRPLIEPVYPLTSGITSRILRKGINSALQKLPELPEWIDKTLSERESFPSFSEALKRIHRPANATDIDPVFSPRRRLAFDEYLANQLALSLVRRSIKLKSGTSRKSTGKLKDRIIANLSFELTECQKNAIHEIEQDLKSCSNMHRLIQGDVGSGKTIVALLSMAHVVETGAQAAIMAPTEILARQHFETISKLSETANIQVEVLTGRDSVRHRRKTEESLANGEIDIIVGTHALFQSGIKFQDLALAVIDEQHRFGVHQRLALSGKGKNTDILVMTATPIPRTLVLTYYGDMDVSKLEGKPSGRLPVKTTSIPISRIDEVIARIKKVIDSGRKVYWICPLVEESDELDITAAEERYKSLLEAIGGRVALVHGRMTGEEKDSVMESFKSDNIRILVATTVIEVGIDIPEASIIVIEHAERFGLAQLHQLRGRVGRGDERSHCLLLFRSPLTDSAKSRLKILRETNDGFRIAEEDLKQRGEGDILGTRQSGSQVFRTADVSVHNNLLEIARKDAQLILEKDPDLSSERGEALRILLYLFAREDVIGLLRAG